MSKIIEQQLTVFPGIGEISWLSAPPTGLAEPS